jgi:hypothetical protein
LYRSADKKGDILDYMTSHGFKLLSASAQSGGQEENLIFER